MQLKIKKPEKEGKSENTYKKRHVDLYVYMNMCVVVWVCGWLTNINTCNQMLPRRKLTGVNISSPVGVSSWCNG